jgi:hypothetical protein
MGNEVRRLRVSLGRSGRGEGGSELKGYMVERGPVLRPGN